MKTKKYNRTYWVDKKTPVNAQNLNKIESAIEELYNVAIEEGFLTNGKGIKISENGEVSITDDVMTSKTVSKIEVIKDETEAVDRDTMYYLLDSETAQLTKIILNGVTIFERG